MVHLNVMEEAAAFMRQQSQAHLPNETGGIVLGTRQGASMTVTHAVGPGPKAVHEPSRFVRDGDFAQEALETAVKQSDGQIDYLGEWHSHPRPAGPSPRDKESLLWISKNPAYGLSEPVLLICQRTWLRTWRINGYLWREHTVVRPKLTTITENHISEVRTVTE